MRVRIHRGAHEIGGNCIEVEADGSRIVLDVGRPLAALPTDVVPLPDVPGLDDGNDKSLLGLFISHGHQDHWGLISQVSPKVPVYMGEAASSILREAAFFTRAGHDIKTAGFLQHRTPLPLGPFLITPYLNDHAGFDTYSLLIEAGGRRLFYTADFEGHGRKADIFEELLRKPPKDVDVMLMEGTNIKEEDAPGDESSEADVENAMVAEFRSAPAMTLILYSAQNMDRLVTIYRAAKRAGKTLVVDLYTATVAAAAGRETIPQPGFPLIAVYVPIFQRIAVKKAMDFERVKAIKPHRLYVEDLVEQKENLVMTFSMGMVRELDKAGCLEGARAVWSMWPGYLGYPSSDKLREFLAAHDIPLSVHHASGHAYVKDLKRMAEAVSPKRLVPIHSFNTDRFADLFRKVEIQSDGAWWEV